MRGVRVSNSNLYAGGAMLISLQIRRKTSAGWSLAARAPNPFRQTARLKRVYLFKSSPEVKHVSLLSALRGDTSL